MQASYYNLAPDDHCFYFNVGCVEEHFRIRKMPATLLEKMRDRGSCISCYKFVTKLLQIRNSFLIIKVYPLYRC